MPNVRSSQSSQKLTLQYQLAHYTSHVNPRHRVTNHCQWVINQLRLINIIIIIQCYAKVPNYVAVYYASLVSWPSPQCNFSFPLCMLQVTPTTRPRCRSNCVAAYPLTWQHLTVTGTSLSHCHVGLKQTHKAHWPFQTVLWWIELTC